MADGYRKKYAFRAESEIGAADTTKEVLTLLFNNRGKNGLFQCNGVDLGKFFQSLKYMNPQKKREPLILDK